jgi:guanylate kinase
MRRNNRFSFSVEDLEAFENQRGEKSARAKRLNAKKRDHHDDEDFDYDHIKRRDHRR